MIEQGRTICSTLTAGDWPIGPCQRISPNPYILFFYEITNNIIPVHRRFLNPRYGERSTSTYPVPPDANVGQSSTSKVTFTPKSYVNSAIRNVLSPQDIIMGCAVCSQNKLPRLRSSCQSTLRSLHSTLHDGTSICLPSTYRSSIDVFW